MFGKVESKRMLVRKVWDHAIDLNDNFKVSKARVYPLSRNKKEEVQKFVDKHLKKGYIRSSKSPQTSLVFFVGKKVLDWQTCNNAIFGTKSFLDTFPIVLISAINHLANLDTILHSL